MRVSIGPIPKDGTGIIPERDIDAMVNGTNLDQFTQENFANTWAPFILSQTDAPASNIRRPGLLWFKRGEGRLYQWQTQLPVVSAGTLGGYLFEGEPGEAWICLSDRKEIYARVWNDGSISANRDLQGYALMQLEFGMSSPDLRWELSGTNPRALAPHVGPRVSLDLSVKAFCSNTNYTVAKDHVAGVVCFEMGFCRLPVEATYTGPHYGMWGDNDYFEKNTSNPPYADAPNLGTWRYPAHICESGTRDDSGRLLGFLFSVTPRSNWT